MIDSNLGNIERVVRLLMGLAFGGWALAQPILNGVEWFVVIISLMLMLNGIFSRCYLWYILEIDTSETGVGNTSTRGDCYLS